MEGRWEEGGLSCGSARALCSRPSRTPSDWSLAARRSATWSATRSGCGRHRRRGRHPWRGPPCLGHRREKDRATRGRRANWRADRHAERGAHLSARTRPRRGPAAEAAARSPGRARNPLAPSGWQEPGGGLPNQIEGRRATDSRSKHADLVTPEGRAERHLTAGEGAAACVDTTHHVSHAEKRRAVTHEPTVRVFCAVGSV